MLPTLTPLSVVLTTIWPSEYTMSLLFIFQVFPSVTATICPLERASTIHLIAIPLTLEGTSILPYVLPITLNVVIMKFAVILMTFTPTKSSSTMLLAHRILAFEHGAICPLLNSTAILLIILPLTFVPRTIFVVISAFSICFVIFPLAFVCVTISVVKLAMPIRSVLSPFAIEFRTIRPHLNTVTIALLPFPLAGVLYIEIQFHLWAVFTQINWTCHVNFLACCWTHCLEHAPYSFVLTLVHHVRARLVEHASPRA
mmetsp:Transcript_33725/g.53623  ORF Transcript_33725/g.53623 Transcript_33725/m.53623 type:complete len:256 (-) Transcript_33725:79-846(-)